MINTLTRSAFSAIALAGATTAHAEEAEVQAPELEASGAVMATHNYNGGIIGVTISEGTHLQGVISVHHESGAFVEVFASTDAIAGSNDPTDSFKGEIDLCAGYHGNEGRVSFQVDACNFWIDTADGVHDIQNVRAFVNWNAREGSSFYAAGQLFLNDDFGPGEGIAYKAGVRYFGFNLEAGGHTGLFGEDATTVSFVRAGWSGEVEGLNVSAYFQKGLAHPIDDTFSISVGTSF